MRYVDCAGCGLQEQLERLGAFADIVVEERQDQVGTAHPPAVFEFVLLRYHHQPAAHRLIVLARCRGESFAERFLSPGCDQDGDRNPAGHAGRHACNELYACTSHVFRERVGLAGEGVRHHRRFLRDDENGRFRVRRLVAADVVHGGREFTATGDVRLEVVARNSQIRDGVAGVDGDFVGPVGKPLPILLQLHRHYQTIPRLVALHRQAQILEAPEDRVAVGGDGDLRGGLTRVDRAGVRPGVSVVYRHRPAVL